MPAHSLDRVIRFIREEHKYDSLPSKALNKLPYLVYKEATKRELDVTIPHFWYMFGVVTADPTSSSSPEDRSETPNGPQTTSIEADAGPLREVVQDVLNQYYETSLEEITDLTYRDAPYDVQQVWRELDKKVRTRHDDYNDFYEVNPSRGDIRASVNQVYDVFPVKQFPNLESDLLDWYSTMTRELNAPQPDIDRLMTANLMFWRIFSLSVAEAHRHDMTREEVMQALGILSFESERQGSRAELRGVEEEALEEKFDGGLSPESPDAEAADAIVDSVLATHLSG